MTPVLSDTASRRGSRKRSQGSLRSWRDFARDCFCFGSEAVYASGEAVRGLVKSPVSLVGETREYGGSAVRPLTNPAS